MRREAAKELRLQQFKSWGCTRTALFFERRNEFMNAEILFATSSAGARFERQVASRVLCSKPLLTVRDAVELGLILGSGYGIFMFLWCF